MKARRFCCFLVALALIAPVALASELQMTIAKLPDDYLIELFDMVVLEMQRRGLSPDDIVISSVPSPAVPAKTPKPQISNADVAFSDVVEYAEYAIGHIPQTETITTYDPPSTPCPTYRALANIQADDTVWISDHGHCYHTTPDCSGMKSPAGVSLASARLSGRSACKDCAWWLGSEEE